MRQRPVAAFTCEHCPSDSADPFFVKDHDGMLVCTVLRCMVCGWLVLA